jgi:hypothetical protein
LAEEGGVQVSKDTRQKLCEARCFSTFKIAIIYFYYERGLTLTETAESLSTTELIIKNAMLEYNLPIRKGEEKIGKAN